MPKSSVTFSNKSNKTIHITLPTSKLNCTALKTNKHGTQKLLDCTCVSFFQTGFVQFPSWCNPGVYLNSLEECNFLVEFLGPSATMLQAKQAPSPPSVGTPWCLNRGWVENSRGASCSSAPRINSIAVENALKVGREKSFSFSIPTHQCQQCPEKSHFSLPNRPSSRP